VRVALISPMARFAMGPYLCLLAEGLSKAGAELLVITSQSFSYKRRLEDRGIQVLTIPRRESMSGQLALMLDPHIYRGLFRTLARFNPDVVHLLTGEGYPLGLLLAIRYGRRLVITLHDPIPHSGSKLDGISRILSLPALLMASTIHVHRECQRRYIKSLWPWKRMTVIPHGSFAPIYDPPQIDPFRKEDLVLFWGRIEPYKGIDILARSLSGLDPRFRVVIAGSGLIDEESRRLILASAQTTLMNRYISDEELRELLIKAKFAIFPYRSATQSSVPLLAASFGVRPIMSPVGAFREIAKEVDGIIMPLLSPEIVARVINTADYRPTGLGAALDFEQIGRAFVRSVYLGISK